MAMLKITILGAEDDAPRKDRNNFTWFKFQNRFFSEQSTFQMTDGQIVLFLYLRCETSKRGVKSIEILSEFISAMLRRPEDEIVKDLRRLQYLRLIDGVTPSERHDNGCPREEKRREEQTREDEITETGVSAAPVPPSQPELELPDSRTYDRDHESVAVKPKPTELPPLAKLWNERKHPDLGQVVMATGPRRKAANARWKEHPDEKFWADAIARVNASDFCLGRVESKDRGRPWKANFDWFVRPDTIAKILEGQYDNRPGPGGSSPSTKLSFWARQQANGGNA